MLNKEEEFYGNISKLESIRTRTYKKINKLKYFKGEINVTNRQTTS